MQHKRWKLLLSFWATSLVTLLTFAAASNAQETLQPYAPPILHTFLDSSKVYPESVTVDQSSGTFFVGSVKERIPVDKCYEFWEREVKPHLLRPHGKVDRSRLPDEYAYLASEWLGHIEVPIVLLEK